MKAIYYRMIRDINNQTKKKKEMKTYYYLGRKADSQNRNDCSTESCDCYIFADDKKAAKKIIKESGMEIVPGHRLKLAIHQDNQRR